ncbi:MAG TPA: head-tail adaptor protein [Xanthobacteraceae bacterium]|nr:head-tail adaptor protein [Xanthobacteraceae bacterium]
MMFSAGRLKDRIRIERPEADDSFAGAGSGSWALVATVKAEVRDMLPSKGERLAQGFNVATRPARVRIRKRPGITSEMRFVMGATVVGEEVNYSGARIMQVVAGPAEIGRHREGLEFMVEEYRPAGNGA